MDPTGAKYNAAQQWGIMCVSIKWLVACADQGSMVPPVDYLVQPLSSANQVVPPLPIGKTACTPVKHPEKPALIGSLSRDVPSTPNTTYQTHVVEHHEKHELNERTLGNTQDIGRKEAEGELHSKEQGVRGDGRGLDMTGFIDALNETVGTTDPGAVGQDASQVDMSLLGAQMTVGLQSAVDMANRKRPKDKAPLSHVTHPPSLPTTPKGKSTAVGWEGSGGEMIGAGFSGQHSRPIIKKRKMWYDEEVDDGKDRKELLAGTCIYVSRLLQEARQGTEWYELARRMGAACVWVYDKATVTHLIHHDHSDKLLTPRRRRAIGRSDTREVRQALSDSKKVVSGAWLQQCYLDGKRLDENDYPPSTSISASHIVPPLATSPRDSKSTPIGVRPVRKTTENGQEQREERGLTDTAGHSPLKKREEREHEKKEKKDKKGEEDKGQIGEGEGADKSAEVAQMMEMLMSALPQPSGRAKLIGRRKLQGSKESDMSDLSKSFDDDSLGGSPDRSKGFTAHLDALTQGPRLSLPQNAVDLEEDMVTYGDGSGRPRMLRSRSSSAVFSDQSTAATTLATHLPPEGTSPPPTNSEVPECKDQSKRIDIREEGKEEGTEERNEAKGGARKAGGKGLFKEPRPVDKTDQEQKEEANREGTDSRPTSKKGYRFLLSAMQGEERQSVTRKIEMLGGSVYNTPYYAPDCTHVVIKYPSGSEKFLAACAGGKWILKESYIYDSVKEGRFLEEEAYIWRESDLDSNDLTNDKGKVVKAANYWRFAIGEQRLAGRPDGAYAGWKVLIFVQSKQHCYERLLEAGGAILISKKAPFSLAEIKSASHAFLDTLGPDTENGLTGEDVKALKQYSVHCLQPQYISAFLLDQPPPDLTRYELAPITPLVVKHRGPHAVKRKTAPSMHDPPETRRRTRGS